MQQFSFTVIGTGSDGNCYLLSYAGQTIIIEAGVVFTKVKKALNFDFSHVVGVLVTHEHGDHNKAIKDFQKFGKKIYCTPGTAAGSKTDKYESIQHYKPFEVGLFKITCFPTFHDARDPCGFIIEFEGKKLAFITDTADLKTRLNDVDYWVIEANYSSEKLKYSLLDNRLKTRIQETHMSIDRCKVILEAHSAENSHLVLLIHGSKKHSNKQEFLAKIPYASIAEDNLIIDL